MDVALLNLFQTWHSGSLDRFMGIVYVLADGSVLAAAGVLIALALWVAGKRSRAAFFALGVLLGLAWIPLLKHMVGRTRPNLPLSWAPTTSSFPSGHVMGSTIFFGLLAILMARGKRHRVQAGIWALAISVILTIGFNRIYLGHHWPSDVLGGYVFGGLWLWVWSRFETRIHVKNDPMSKV